MCLLYEIQVQFVCLWTGFSLADLWFALLNPEMAAIVSWYQHTQWLCFKHLAANWVKCNLQWHLRFDRKHMNIPCPRLWFRLPNGSPLTIFVFLGWTRIWAQQKDMTHVACRSRGETIQTVVSILSGYKLAMGCSRDTKQPLLDSLPRKPQHVSDGDFLKGLKQCNTQLRLYSERVRPVGLRIICHQWRISWTLSATFYTKI